MLLWGGRGVVCVSELSQRIENDRKPNFPLILPVWWSFTLILSSFCTNDLYPSLRQDIPQSSAEGNYGQEVTYHFAFITRLLIYLPEVSKQTGRESVI